MKSYLRFVVSICMALCICCAISVTAFAEDAPTQVQTHEVTSSVNAIQPRVGIAGYRNYYHNGSTYQGRYTISTSSIALPSKECTIELGDFEPGTWILIDILNSKGQPMRSVSFSAIGNGKWENLSLNPLYFINGDTYTISYRVYTSSGSPLYGDDGWIGIWFF